MLISVVVPCFNEEEALPIFYQRMETVRASMDYELEYIFINDGSRDNTLQVLRELQGADKAVRYLSFSRNFGKEAALYAGLQAAKGALVTVMDVDLQDPPELLKEMTTLLEADADLDCAGCRRATRDGEPPIRSFFARLFYRIINHISNVELVDGARDFRLMRRPMVDAILEVTEYNRFCKGIFAWVGFNTVYLPYKNVERVAGETSWSFWSLLRYSMEGIVNFSDTPLDISSFVGFFTFLLSLIGAAIVIFKTLAYGDPTIGWPSVICIILFVGGIQLMTIGVLGKYISKIFLETKKRPLYLVKEKSE
ncbi:MULTISPECIES: glycosyltransferase family 2 protein [unclassified Streptococcus]|uniref:glycosyltransferase family 2 protein n=1 Tax=unclassified Streptococcus TaxID=2608887 RepID=UPI00066FF115|nr:MULTISPECIES: glycosyltransferase family 2 protein [unclassified Streptococcus]